VVYRRLATLGTLLVEKIEGCKKPNLDICLAYTHGQAAEPMLVMTRYATWLQDVSIVIKEVAYAMDNIMLRGVQGPVGPSLLASTHATVGALRRFRAEGRGRQQWTDEVNKALQAEFDFPSQCWSMTTQTHPLLQDVAVYHPLVLAVAACMRIANSIRLLAAVGDWKKARKQGEYGSSVMSYKSNPRLAERAVSLGRLVIQQAAVVADVAGDQWAERSLDNSASSRCVWPRAFEATTQVLDDICKELSNYHPDMDVIRQKIVFEHNERAALGCAPLRVFQDSADFAYAQERALDVVGRWLSLTQQLGGQHPVV
jgi:adenylosuccinate lyase